MITCAPYFGVLFGVACAWWYLRRSLIPALPRGWQAGKIAAGDCPEEHCGGKTYMLATESFSTLWRCVECKQTWLLASLPRE